MQFRESGGRVQLLRSVYLKEKKRSQAKLLGSLAIDARELPVELAVILTLTEHSEFAVWMEKRIAADRVAQARREIETLPQVLQNVSGHVMRGAQLTPAQVKGVWDGTAQLRRQLAKAGYTKPSLQDPPQE